MDTYGKRRIDGPDRPNGEDVPGVGSAPRGRRLRRALVGLGLTLAVLLPIGLGASWYLTDRYAGNLDRVSAFDGLDESRRPAAPTAPAGKAPLTVLVVGSDTRAEAPAGELPDGRSDVMMLVRVTGDRRHAQVVSLPRDSWVSIPGVGMAKLNAAYAHGGPGLLIETVESMTGVRIDHYAAIDFSGFVQMTDALGGVDVEVAETTTSGPYTYTAGPNHLDGQQALQYVRQRHSLPGGDFDRVKRQQQYLRSVFTALSQQEVLSDMGALDGFLLALTDAMTVDETLSTPALLALAYDLRALRPDALAFLTAPVAGTGREGTQSVVYLEQERGDRLWSYLRSDSLQTHAAEFGLDSLPVIPN